MKTRLFNFKTVVLTLAFLSTCMGVFAQPIFNSGQDPKPSNKNWQKVDNLSDEFSGTALNTSKWKNTDPARWIGRAPGIFKANTVSVGGNSMRITNYKLSSPEWHNGQQFTHAGGHVISQNKVKPGYYIECRMKANKTFMSSTFWLINYRNEGTGCDQRVTELDIQECVGVVNNNQGWTQSFDKSMHSNTHSRNVSCNEPVGSKGNDVTINGKVYENYHVYGAWWKSSKEVLFYLDGKYQYTVTPVADFDLDMYIKLVTETYDWNPAPADGGMTGSWNDRTTFYDWVRTWKLVDGGSGGGSKVAIKGSNGKYVSSENGTKAMTCNRTTIGGWEKFTLNVIGKSSTGNDIVTLKGSNGQYVSSENGTGPINCNRSSAGDWEKFELLHHGNQVYSLKNMGKYVSSENGVSAMTCNRTAVGGWEKFTFTYGLSRLNTDNSENELNPSVMTIYPNPLASGHLTIQLEGAETFGNVRILDLNGKVIFTVSGLLESHIIVSADTFAHKGLYIVEKTNEYGTERQKLVLK